MSTEVLTPTVPSSDSDLTSTEVPETNELNDRQDANDYRRFENISDSDDDDMPTSSSPSTTKEVLPFHESIYRSQTLKEQGNQAFKENNYVIAKQYYEDALGLITPHKNVTPINDITPEKVSEMKSLYISLHSNTSMVHFKEENWSFVLKSTDEILKEDPENIKALYRRAVAHHRTGFYDESKDGLNLILSLDSTNAAAKKELNEVLKSIKEQKRKEKEAMSAMFSGSIYGDREEERQRKLRREKEAEEKLHDEYLKEKLKKRSEGIAESEIEISYEDWKKQRKKREEDEKKAEEKRREEERKKQQSENNQRKKQKTTPKSSASGNSGEIEYDEEDSKIINETTSKGYCYFKRQLPTEESKLIGDITPKAVTSANPSPSPVAAMEATPSPQATSAVEASSWNAAGTWEERDTTALVKDRMKELCLSGNASLTVGETPAGTDMQSALSDAMKAIDMTSGAASSTDSLQNSLEAMKTAISPIRAIVSEVQSIDGEAQIVLTRGKKCYLYDFTIKLKIEVTVEETPLSSSLDGAAEKSKPQVYKGSLEISDVCPGTGFEWKLTFKKANVPERVRKCAHKLKDDIFMKLQSFDSEYRAL